MTKPDEPPKPPAQPLFPGAVAAVPAPASRVAATRGELIETLSYALRFNGSRVFPQASTLMARITAEHLATHLERAGYELTRRPVASAPSTSTSGHAHPGSGGKR